MLNMFFVTLTAFLTLLPGIAFAYVEPGTGLMISQLLIGALAGGLVTLKLYWHKLKEKFGAKTSIEPDTKAAADPDQST
jgi:hypothetical protein